MQEENTVVVYTLMRWQDEDEEPKTVLSSSDGLSVRYTANGLIASAPSGVEYTLQTTDAKPEERLSWLESEIRTDYDATQAKVNQLFLYPPLSEDEVDYAEMRARNLWADYHAKVQPLVAERNYLVEHIALLEAAKDKTP